MFDQTFVTDLGADQDGDEVIGSFNGVEESSADEEDDEEELGVGRGNGNGMGNTSALVGWMVWEIIPTTMGGLMVWELGTNSLVGKRRGNGVRASSFAFFVLQYGWLCIKKCGRMYIFISTGGIFNCPKV